MPERDAYEAVVVGLIEGQFLAQLPIDIDDAVATRPRLALVLGARASNDAPVETIRDKKETASAHLV